MQPRSARQKSMMKFLIKEMHESIWIVDPVSVLSCEKKRRDLWLLYVSFVVLAMLPQLLEAIWSSWPLLLEQASPKFIIKTLSKFDKFLPKFIHLFQKNQTSYPYSNRPQVNVCIPTYVGRVTWSHTWSAVSHTDIQLPQSMNSYLEVRYKARGHTPTLRSWKTGFKTPRHSLTQVARKKMHPKSRSRAWDTK